ncbi:MULTISPECIES: serine/threonine protein kinase [unclassified Corallococcus]|uniref:serine/threonine protein kinase n=1 Tax=unclassified Corallococcus TaxID=2685029 RepID=UPI001A8DDF69|nr:serine/threonine protein kinase [Corallococcus sp. NCRR]MBN9684209.1 protein kinase [Corallococcus sp. NCSPR001]WAS84303.1 protein kinase [Corallococcus sp. NCRR]
MTLEAGTHVGKYVVRRKLAEGGMAEIFLCTARGPEGFEKEVVIKRVRSFLASDPDFVQMFIAEARLASRLNHANVVQIFDFDKHEDTYYLAMEYVRGCSLWELRKRSKEAMTPMPPVLVAHIGVEVARGLHYAHRLRVNGELLNLVHRDVTPHNVLVSYDGAVKLTDFGIAKAGNKLTNPGVLKGKFAYMSPEQARGESVDVRTDVFALGVVLWELLTGGRLFQGDSEIAVLRAVQESTIVPPARLNPDVPPDLDAAIRRALERDLSKRFQTAGELERALAQCVLNHARSVDDTDVGAFVRPLFPIAASNQALPALPERTALQDGALPAPGEPPREPTAVMPSREHASGAKRGVSPDEDRHGTTLVLSRDEPAQNGRPPQPTPQMPLQSMGREAPLARRSESREVPAARDRAAEDDGASASHSEDWAGSSEDDSASANHSEDWDGSSAAGALASHSEDWAGSSDAGAPASRRSEDGGSRSAASARRAEASSRKPDTASERQAGASGRPDTASARRAGSSGKADAAAASRGALVGDDLSGADDRELDTVSATEPGPPVAPGRKRALWAGAAALGLAGLVGVLAVARSNTGARDAGQGSPPAQATAPAVTPPPTTAPAANPPPAEPARAPSTEAVNAELEGQRREAALTPPPSTEPATPAATPTADPATEPPAAEAAKAMGTLQVKATPYATVFLGAKRLGDVQGRASYKVPAGTYSVTFQHPTSKKTFTVVVPADGTVQQEFRASRGR